MKITGPSEKLHVIGFILTVIILHINYDTIDTYRVFDFWSIRMNKQWVRLILNHYKKKTNSVLMVFLVLSNYEKCWLTINNIVIVLMNGDLI